MDRLDADLSTLWFAFLDERLGLEAFVYYRARLIIERDVIRVWRRVHGQPPLDVRVIATWREFLTLFPDAPASLPPRLQPRQSYFSPKLGFSWLYLGSRQMGGRKFYVFVKMPPAHEEHHHHQEVPGR